MTETEANLWLMSMREALHANRGEVSGEVYTQFNDLIRFLEEFCCPKRTEAAARKLGIWVCPECGSRGYESSHVCGDGS